MGEDYGIIPDVKDVNLSDFAFFTAVMKEKEAYECVLSIILDEPGLKLKTVKVENVVLNDSGYRAIRLDSWALDYKDRQFNSEMQNDTEHDIIPKRSRFYQSLMDSHTLKAGKAMKYKNMPDTMIIFITQDDIFHKDVAQYIFTEKCDEFPEMELQDGTKKIFLNMKSLNGRADQVSLLQYMKNTDIDNPNIICKDERMIRLDRIVNEVRESEEWEESNMSIYAQGMEQGRKQGEKARLAMIKTFVDSCARKNMDSEHIESQLEEMMGLDKESARLYTEKFGNKTMVK